MIASSALVLTMILAYGARSRVLSFDASCGETRAMLRDARNVPAANGASTRSTLPFGAISVTTALIAFVFVAVESKASMTAISPALPVEQCPAERELLHLGVDFLNSRGLGAEHDATTTP